MREDKSRPPWNAVNRAQSPGLSPEQGRPGSGEGQGPVPWLQPVHGRAPGPSAAAESAAPGRTLKSSVTESLGGESSRISVK